MCISPKFLQIALALLLGFVAFLSLFPSSAIARKCEWRGTAPSCGGQESDCKPGEKFIENAGAAKHALTEEGKRTPFGAECIFGGFKVLCCTVEAPVAQAVDPAAWASFCDRYATDALSQVLTATELKCRAWKPEVYGGDRWTPDRAAHFNWCIGKDGAYAEPTQEGLWRTRQLDECKKHMAKPVTGLGKKKPDQPPQFCRVLLPVDVYPLPNRNNDQERKAILKKDTQGVTLIKRDPDGWHNVKWPGNEGWAWSGKKPDYESLECPQ